MTDRPILFSGPMVRAILAGQKTQTRRVIDPLMYIALGTDLSDPERIVQQTDPTFGREAQEHVRCPYGVPGDRLWVRETWGNDDSGNRTPAACWYRADGCVRCAPDATVCEHGPARWRPSIHMPRWASRLTLEVVSVRVERLQEMTPADLVAEGPGAAELLAAWDPKAWAWVIEFKRVTP